VPQAESLMATSAIKGGMAPKLEGAINAVRGGVKRAHLINGLTPHSLLQEVFTRKGKGTMVIDAAAEKEYLERG
jgi:acetylglutamate kinase